MSPDCAWAEACVLMGKTRTTASFLHLRPLTTGIKEIGLFDNLQSDNFNGQSSMVNGQWSMIYDLLGRRSTGAESIVIEQGRKILHR